MAAAETTMASQSGMSLSRKTGRASEAPAWLLDEWPQLRHLRLLRVRALQLEHAEVKHADREQRHEARGKARDQKEAKDDASVLPPVGRSKRLLAPVQVIGQQDQPASGCRLASGCLFIVHRAQPPPPMVPDSVLQYGRGSNPWRASQRRHGGQLIIFTGQPIHLAPQQLKLAL